MQKEGKTMALTNELISTLRNTRNNINLVNTILNDYNQKQDTFNKLTGEDLVNAYKIAGVDR